MVEQIKLYINLKDLIQNIFLIMNLKKNVLLILHQVLKKYYQIIMKENETYVDIILIYFNDLNIFCR